MKSTVKALGIVRQIDELGRVVIPVELRRTLGIEVKDGMEIFVDGNKIILQKYEPGCTFCGEVQEKPKFIYGKIVCDTCAEKVHKLLQKRP